jgi:dienelactone hydrolase
MHRLAGLALTAALLSPLSTPASPPLTGVSATEVTFQGNGTTLHGSIVRGQDSDPGLRHPGVVLVHGSSGLSRDTLNLEAKAFAEAGIVTLIYDKRADYTTFHRDYSLLADDALAAVRTLRGQSDVDSAAVGVWGYSEGGWIAPLAASRSADVAFVVTVGGTGVEPIRGQSWQLAGRLMHQGVSARTANRLATRGTALLDGLGLYAQARHDPVPALRGVKQPVLAVFGARDMIEPPRESAEVFKANLTASKSVTVAVVPGASHQIKPTPDGYELADTLDPAYVRRMTEWVDAVASGHTPASHADALPVQSHDSVPVDPFGVLGLVYIGLVLVAVIACLVLRRWGFFFGLGALLGLALYAFFVATQKGRAGGVLLGVPVPLLVLRAVVIVALVLGVRSLLRSPSGKRRLVPAAAMLLLLPYAIGVGPILP